MPSYREQPFGKRLAALGDQAEHEYTEREPHGPCQRFGWKRPKVTMAAMRPMLRHMPDFYTGTGYLVEVMGCGQDGILKGLKVPKWEALGNWHYDVQSVKFWLWNSSQRRGYTVHFGAMALLVIRSRHEFGILKFEVDGNEYHPIPWSWVEEVGEPDLANDGLAT